MNKDRSSNNCPQKIIIFDLDGTLYEFKKGSFKQSLIYKKVLENTEEYIRNKLNITKKEAKLILKEIIKEYGESISIGLEKKHKLDRYEYFNNVWNIPAKKYIKSNPFLRNKLLKIKNHFDFVLVSDAPKIWIKHVLERLEIDDIFKNRIFSGEGNARKEFGNVFDKIVKILRINPHCCIIFGDQEKTDIIPAKKIGMRTVLVNRKKKSSIADYTIKSILEIEKALKYLKVL